MSAPLWTAEALVAAAGAVCDGTIADPITGFSIDTRTLEPGDVFVALSDQRDGHAFVTQAFQAGAAAALVRTDYERRDGNGALLRVDDPLEALVAIGRKARARLHETSRVIAVTGSAGKTTTKEMLRACFEAIAPGRTHASVKSYNNHWGVPLTLARMPADTRFAVFEIGMNHAGEITPLSKMVRPHFAVVTSVLPVHIGNFDDGIEGIANAKAEIFAGLEEGGTAIIPGDSDHAETLADTASRHGARVSRFGAAETNAYRAVIDSVSAERISARFVTHQTDLPFQIAMGGQPNASNAVAALAVIDLAASQHKQTACDALARLKMAPQGRGQVFPLADDITLIDESYNANPASVAAAIETQSLYPRQQRRVAVLGDMLELGPHATSMHERLAGPLNEAQIDVLFCCGPHMRALFVAVPPEMRGTWAPTSAELVAPLLEAVHAGDIIMVKGSLGSK
ncbi:MAG: UDP-N-acetylmuramoyl-tripeptide--D-alanyl-D-alanine ligase, partial [Pseudomonadota bacterium]